MIHSPCKDCPDREMGCHNKCSKYQSYAIEAEKMREYKRKCKWIEDNYRSFGR